MKSFDGLHGLDGAFEILPPLGSGLPGFRNDSNIPPLIKSGGVHEQELIDALRA
ncbi:hypothetical protein [Methylobacterium frigidaeris]|uniref:hypothetical protein n=1 Tax=Methylobacterium frigidaeris TaxID=2038277 RepID=UPI001EE034B3|nr:hypothetical protein [Methylobacterium frigidaeris]